MNIVQAYPKLMTCDVDNIQKSINEKSIDDILRFDKTFTFDPSNYSYLNHLRKRILKISDKNL